MQRANVASVSVDNSVVGKIDKGLFILVGVKEGDTVKDAEVLAEKISKLRIMSDDKGKMNLSVKDTNASILAVSQFTLHADTRKGNRPSFVKAADPKLAEEVYDHFINKLKEYDINAQTGQFGEYMKIKTELDGPVTIIVDSK